MFFSSNDELMMMRRRMDPHHKCCVLYRQSIPSTCQEKKNDSLSPQENSSPASIWCGEKCHSPTMVVMEQIATCRPFFIDFSLQEKLQPNIRQSIFFFGKLGFVFVGVIIIWVNRNFLSKNPSPLSKIVAITQNSPSYFTFAQNWTFRNRKTNGAIPTEKQAIQALQTLSG